jgi:polyisoprenoid-binding protein YceI
MDQESSARERRTRELDEEIGVTSGNLGAPQTARGGYAEVSSDMATAEGVTFQVRDPAGANVDGRFTKWRGYLLFDMKAPQNSHIQVEIDAASIDTKEPQRDADLRSADFFDVEKYPKILFDSTKVECVGDRFRLTGNLTMHGVKRPITLDAEYVGRVGRLGERAGFQARGSLDRKDWGVTWSQDLDNGEGAIGDRIEIRLGIEAHAVT